MRLGPGALVWAAFDGESAPAPLLDAIRDGRVGGLVLFAFRGNIRSKQQVRGMIREIQSAAKRGDLPPIPIAVDQEGGSVVRVGYRAVFPSAMAIGATDDPALAGKAARAVGEGLVADGIAVNLAPVCDVISGPSSPVIGTRAFGSDPQKVAAFVSAWVRGSKDAGIATTAKHFPGHGPSTVDSHHSKVDVTADRKTLEERDLVPFRAAFDAGASMVMTAHVRYLALDPDAPATLSKAILTDLLRTALRFRGLCVSDALDMSGISNVDSIERVVARALDAGVDAVMMTTSLESQLAAASWIERNASAARVTEAIDRANTIRSRFGHDVPAGDVDDSAAVALARDIAAASITHVGPPLPDLRGRVRVAAFAPGATSPVEELSDPISALERALRQRFGERLAFGRDGQLPDGDGPVVVCTTNAAFAPEQADRARQLLAHGGMLCALRSPYDAALAPKVPALLSYGDVPASLDALAAVLAGERRAEGRLPVDLRS